MLLARHAASDRIAVGAAGSRTAAELLRDAGAIAAALPAPSAGRWALLALRRDRYVFMAGVLGAWARGYDIAVPSADVTRERFLQLAQGPEIGVVLHDTLSTAAVRVDRVLASARSDDALTAAQLARDGLLQLDWGDASRATGAWETGARWRRSELLARTTALASERALPDHALCIASVLPETPFGLMLGCLWPLLSGGTLWRDDPRTGSWLSALPEHAAEHPVLVSMPAHVRMALRSERQPLAAVRHLVSADGVLPDVARSALAGYPRLTLHDMHAQTSPEPVALDPLAGLEERIAWLPGVEDAALLAVRAATGLALHLVVLVAGDNSLDERSLRASLSELFPEHTFGRVLVLPAPPLTASVASFSGGTRHLRRAGSGAHDRAGLLRLFGLDAAGRALSFQLQLGQDQAGPGANEHRFAVHVPDNYAYYEGHFPGYPIMAGAVQLSELVLPCVRRVRPELGHLVRMSRLKFQERIVPGNAVELVLSFHPDPTQIDFSIRRGTTVCAAGRLVFAQGLQS
ncbi:MAG: hypothetical protein ABW321_22855 [Polyangiales bacterium]